MASIKLEPIDESELERTYMEDNITINSVNVKAINRNAEDADNARKFGPNRVQHYRVAWERNPMFAGWLAPGRNSRKARCLTCQSEMTADISVLKYHALCIKHLAKVPRDAEDVTTDDLVSRQIALDYEPDILKKGFYNQCWEQDRRYGSWILPGNGDRQAYCRLCSVHMAADTAVLRRHLATYSHMKAAEFDEQMQKITSMVMEKNGESIDIESTIDDECSDTVLVHEIMHCEGDGSTLELTQQQMPGHILDLFRVKDDRGDALERLSFIMGKFLLKGHKMLNATCKRCGCVLLQDRKQSRHCVGCRYGLMEEINSGVTKKKVKRARNVVTDYGDVRQRSTVAGRRPQARHARPPARHARHVLPQYARHVLPQHDIVETVYSAEDDQSVEGIFIKEEGLTEIVINEDSSAEVVCEVIEEDYDDDDVVEPCGVQGVDLSGEVVALVLTLQSRLVQLTEQLETDGADMDGCLDNLDKTVTALAKIKCL